MEKAAVHPVPETAEAFLVTCAGHSWRDVYRLAPGVIVTIGRESTNRIIIRDEKCSRNHCTVYDEAGCWRIRDLGSSNGTLVNGVEVVGESILEAGDVIQIASGEFLFTDDITSPRFAAALEDESPDVAELVSESEEADEAPEPKILERKSDSRYLLQNIESAASIESSAFRRAVTQLYRLAVRMVSASDARSVADIALDGLCARAHVDIAAILLLPEPTEQSPNPKDLRIISYRAPEGTPYRRVSRQLSSVVLNERDAVHSLDLAHDSYLGNFQTLAEIQARSVICAPICDEHVIYGLIHLYSLSSLHRFDDDTLEFTLAVADQVTSTLKNLRQKEFLATGLQRARHENQSLRQLLKFESDLIGESQSMQQLRDTIARAAVSDATVLVCGESGVGKELVACALHFNSLRRNRPFICLNCAALSEGLLESELFGHEKGSFTGATQRTIGKFEQADGGTLFLDEVGEMSLPLQTKLLRVLEGHPFERVGGRTPIDVDVRVVAATNRDLKQAVEDGSFRKDLFFRLHILEILVPPLREHAEDIPQLADHFLQRCLRKSGGADKRITQDALELLSHYEWPGNVRELKNIIERAAAFSDGVDITANDVSFSNVGKNRDPLRSIGASTTAPARPTGYVEMTIAEWERIHILATMEQMHWKKRPAASILGIERSTLDRKLKRYGIECPSRPQPPPTAAPQMAGSEQL